MKIKRFGGSSVCGAMYYTLQISSLLLAAATLCAQTTNVLTVPPSGNNQKASVTQFIGPVKITVNYSSPSVRDRRGKIWGRWCPMV